MKMISVTIVTADLKKNWCKIFVIGNKNSSLTIAENIITRLKQEREYVLIS